MKIFKISAIIFCVFFINTTYAQNQVPKTTTKKSVAPTNPIPIQVSGQIFIVTAGRNAIKLPLVSVFAYEKNEAINQISIINSSNESRKNFLGTEFLTQKKKIEDIENEMNDTERNRIQAQSNWSNSLGTTSSSSNKEKYDEISSHYRSLIGIKGEEQAKLNSLVREFAELTGPKNYINKLQNYKSIGKSDIDGLFTLNLLPGNYAIVAMSSRSIGRSTELYYWIIEKTIKDNSEKIILSNDNIFGSNCQECIKLPE
jgi:hypothetical protein